MQRFIRLQFALLCALLLLSITVPSVLAIHEGEGEEDCCTQATHIVVAGDNLTRIAERYGSTVAELQAANQLTDSVIQIGQTLVIPGALGSVVDVEPQIMPTSYTVKTGDSLAKIARKFDTTIETLKTLNALDTDVIQIGQLLQLPSPALATLTLADLPPAFGVTLDAESIVGTELDFGMLVEQDFAFISTAGDQEVFGFVANPTIDHGKPISDVLLEDLQSVNGDGLQIIPLSNQIGDKSWRATFVENTGFADIVVYDIVVFETQGKVGAVLTASLFVTPTILLDVEQLAATLASRVTP